MRTIIYNGKGGVGKTSVSVATARRMAKLGHRTIIMSSDTAHSLADSMDVKLTHEITHVCDNLDALEVDIIHEMRTKWSSISDYVSSFLLSQGMEDISAEEMTVIPGMEMVAVLFYVLQFKETDAYDVVIIDTAPSGETLRLLSFPDVSNWYIDKLFSLMKRVATVARATVGKVIDIPLPSKDVIATVEDLKNRMERVRDILEDPKNTSIRLVVNPERMVINETMRSYTYLCMYNKNVECLIVNKVLPDDTIGFFSEKLKEQKEYMNVIHEAFDPMKIMVAHLMPTELRGTDKLDALADMIFGDSDPIEVYSNEAPIRFTSDSDFHRLHIKMPFVDKSSIELFKTNDNAVILETGSQRRRISLPMTLFDSELDGAGFTDGELIIRFKREKDD